MKDGSRSGFAGVWKFLKTISRRRDVSILLPLITIIVIVSLINRSFLSLSNFVSISRSASLYGIVAIGMTFVIIAGLIDISVGSQIGFTCAIMGILIRDGMQIPLAVLITLVVGAVVGIVNGSIIVAFNMPPMICTMGMMFILRGLLYVVTDSKAVYGMPEAFTEFGQATLFGIPMGVVIFLALAIVAQFVLTKTTYGRKILAIGGNEETAWLSGLRVRALKVSVFVITGVMAGISGILLAARVGSVQPNAGETWEMMIIAGTAVGGTSMLGGVGSIVGTVLGTFLVCMLTNVLVMLKVNIYWQKVVTGAIIIGAVALDEYRRRLAARRQIRV